jgi:hypothetical protein
MLFCNTKQDSPRATGISPARDAGQKKAAGISRRAI